MTKKRNQHFVPRCYLRPFSVLGEGRAVHLYNVQRANSIKNASVRGQCSERYFYGKDPTIENALKLYEDLYSDLIRVIKSSTRDVTLEDLATLRGFMALLYARTDAALERTRSFFGGMDNTLRRLTNSSAAHFDLSHRHMLLRALSDFSVVRENIADLRACLVTNHTSTDFITSDDPVAFSSRFHAEKLRSDNFGIGSPGIIFALPLSPRLLLLCYDGSVYIAPDKKAHCIVFTDDRDVYATNLLQYLGARENIYFSDWEQRHQIASEMTSTTVDRRGSRPRFSIFPTKHESPAAQHSGGTVDDDAKRARRALIAVSGHHTFPKVWISKLRWRKRVHYVDTRSHLGYLRAEVWWNRSQQGEPSTNPDARTRYTVRPPAVSVCAEVDLFDVRKSRAPEI